MCQKIVQKVPEKRFLGLFFLKLHFVGPNKILKKKQAQKAFLGTRHFLESFDHNKMRLFEARSPLKI